MMPISSPPADDRHVKTEAIAQPRAAEKLPLEAIMSAVETVRFGVVQLIIQDGRIVQIDKTEKIRLA